MAKAPTGVGYSPLFRSYMELTDVITVLVHCPEERTYLIAFDPTLDLHVPYIVSKGSTWGQLVTLFLKEYLGMPTTMRLEKLWRIHRIWKNDNEGFITNALFEVAISSELKKKLTICKNPKGQDRAVWMNEAEIEAAHKSTALLSPDILTLIPVSTEMNGKMSIYNNCAQVTNYSLVEVPREYIYPGTNTNIYDLLLESMDLKQQQIGILYREYLRLTFPNIIMGYKSLERFAGHAGWSENIWKIAVRGADMNDKGGISFKELLYLICVVDPSCNPTGLAAEARSRFIFRCFDINRNNKLSPKEFTELIISLRGFQPPDLLGALEKDIEHGLRSLDLKKGSEVPLQHFLQGTSIQKFKGIDTMLKSKRSIMSSYIANIEKKMSASIIDLEATKHDIEPSISITSCESYSPSVEFDYKLSNHLAKVFQGRLNESVPLEKIEGGWCPPRPKKLPRHLSDELYNIAVPCNQVLYMLKNFTTQFSSASDVNLRTSISREQPRISQGKWKKRFDWETQEEFEKFVKYLIIVSSQVAKIFEMEPRLISLESPIYIFGDIHGNIQDIICYDQYIWPLGITLFGGKILFLGDYVDRGQFGIEVVAFLFAHKVRAQNQFFLIRGNHEVRSIQKNFTFYNECIKRCGSELGNELWEAVNKAFDCLPLAVLIDKKLFCCHGGIPPPWSCPTVQYIHTVPNCLPQPEKNAIAWNLLWNDPVRENQMNESLLMELLANNGFAKNKKRGTGYVFDTTALEKFLNVNNLSYVIRAHEAQEHGYQIHHKGKIITVFSSSYYNGGSNSAACLLVKLGCMKLMQINTNEYHL